MKIKTYISVVDEFKAWYFDIYFDKVEFYLNNLSGAKVDFISQSLEEFYQNKKLICRLGNLYGPMGIIAIANESIFSKRMQNQIKYYGAKLGLGIIENSKYDVLNVTYNFSEIWVGWLHKGMPRDYSQSKTYLSKDFKYENELHELIRSNYGKPALEKMINFYHPEYIQLEKDDAELMGPSTVLLNYVNEGSGWSIKICDEDLYFFSDSEKLFYSTSRRYLPKNKAVIGLIKKNLARKC